MKTDRNKLFAFARSALIGYELHPSDFHRKLEFKADDAALEFLERTHGQKKTNEFLKNDLPIYYWQAQWRSDKSIKSEEKQTPAPLIESHITADWVDRITVFLTQDGTSFGYLITAKEKARGAKLSRERASMIADSIIQNRLGEKAKSFLPDKYNQKGQENRIDHQFRYKQEQSVHGLTVYLELDIIGDKIGKLGLSYQPPEDFEQKSKNRIQDIFELISFMGLSICFIYVLIRKLRADEINFKFGLPFGIVGVITMAFILFPKLEFENLFEFFLALIIAPIFVGVSLLLASSIGEASTREAWSNKLLTFDTLFKGRILHQEFGLALVRGVTIGFILAGIITVLSGLFHLIEPISLNSRNEHISALAMPFPFLNLVSFTIYNVLWPQIAFLLFLSSFLARWFRFRGWIVIVVALVWAFIGGGAEVLIMNPFWIRFLTSFILSALLVFFFFRFDFLTAFISQFTFQCLFFGYPLLFYENNLYIFNGLLFLLLIGSILVLGIVGLRHYVAPDELQTYVPSFVKQIRERERLKRELEVARKVQLSFLPNKLPQIAGLDIATICIPAMEVGGDYYDFVQLSEDRLGIVVGDVSGKGISAAFYMTLTKGFLKSQAKILQSPRETLIRINELFFENVERGHFISMIYGIFDMKKRMVSFARAGHNPLIIHRSELDRSEVLCPRGIALGLERGKIFEKTIEELSINLHFQDIFLFYTDGYSEAMNKDNQEFGENRLVELVKGSGNLLAQDLMKQINEKITNFVGKKQQHDDMTMVIVKVI